MDGDQDFNCAKWAVMMKCDSMKTDLQKNKICSEFHSAEETLTYFFNKNIMKCLKESKRSYTICI